MNARVMALAGLAAILLAAGGANAQTHAPWPTDWNNWSDPALWCTVGDPGNAPDTEHQTGYGAVNYAYSICKYEVTAGQYTHFLNAVAKTDLYGLYNINMDQQVYLYGCNIKRSGIQGDYTYSVESVWANRPVNFISWGDAARFVNWLTNGQPNGSQNRYTTEHGSYCLNGANDNASLLAATRKTITEGGQYYIPTEEEWYKAAFYRGGSTNAGYWDYPTSTTVCPSNDLIDPDPGNNANYQHAGDYTVGGPYYRTEVGEFENSESPYGTYDQGGNVAEWSEGVYYSGAYRGLQGGSFVSDYLTLVIGASPSYQPTYEHYFTGFRVSEVPEPASMAVLALGSIGMLIKRVGVQR